MRGVRTSPAYRARQLFEALYRQRVRFDRANLDLAAGFTTKLGRQKGFSLGCPALKRNFVSSDGTVRYLWLAATGRRSKRSGCRRGMEEKLETAAMPETRLECAGRNWDRATICVSSQVGCAVDCQFCLTALLGYEAQPYRGRNRRASLCRPQRSECFASQ